MRAVLPSYATTGDKAYTMHNKVVMALATLASYSAAYLAMERERATKASQKAARAKAMTEQRKQHTAGVVAVDVSASEEAAPKPQPPGHRLSAVESVPDSVVDPAQTSRTAPTCPFASRSLGDWIG